MNTISSQLNSLKFHERVLLPFSAGLACMSVLHEISKIAAQVFSGHLLPELFGAQVAVATYAPLMSLAIFYVASRAILLLGIVMTDFLNNRSLSGREIKKAPDLETVKV